jgi:hypothetical protein
VPLGAWLGGSEGSHRVGDRRSSLEVLVFAPCPAAAPADPLPRVLVSTTADATLLPQRRSGGRGSPRFQNSTFQIAYPFSVDNGDKEFGEPMEPRGQF